MSSSALTPTHPCTHGGDNPACRSYHPGHNVHYIQARLASEHRGRWVRVRLAAPRGNTAVVTFPDGTSRTWWSHDPERLDLFHTLSSAGAAVAYDPGVSLALVESGDGAHPLLHPADVTGEPPAALHADFLAEFPER